MSRFLLYLPALACPLLMLVCMAGMRRMGGTPAQTDEPPPADTADRIARLERELAALRAEQQETPPTPARSRPRRLRRALMPTRHPRSGYRDGAGQHRPVGDHHEGADASVARGEFGELEQVIMEVVWSANRPVTGREVVDELTRDRPVVYTTVLTVMDRLARKGILEKHPTGKAHTYQAVQSREAYTAQRMASLLGTGGDATAVLLRFVEQLPPEQAAKLRAALQPGRGHTPRSEP